MNDERVEITQNCIVASDVSMTSVALFSQQGIQLRKQLPILQYVPYCERNKSWRFHICHIDRIDTFVRINDDTGPRLASSRPEIKQFRADERFIIARCVERNSG